MRALSLSHAQYTQQEEEEGKERKRKERRKQGERGFLEEEKRRVEGEAGEGEGADALYLP